MKPKIQQMFLDRSNSCSPPQELYSSGCFFSLSCFSSPIPFIIILICYNSVYLLETLCISQGSTETQTHREIYLVTYFLICIHTQRYIYWGRGRFILVNGSHNLGAGNFKICRVGQQARNLGRSCTVLRQKLFFQETLVFALKAFS